VQISKRESYRGGGDGKDFRRGDMNLREIEYKPNGGKRLISSAKGEKILVRGCGRGRESTR